jgi:hypothetical protein
MPFQFPVGVRSLYKVIVHSVYAAREVRLALSVGINAVKRIAVYVPGNACNSHPACSLA